MSGFVSNEHKDPRGIMFPQPIIRFVDETLEEILPFLLGSKTMCKLSLHGIIQLTHSGFGSPGYHRVEQVLGIFDAVTPK
jgi:hypothetical protein